MSDPTPMMALLLWGTIALILGESLVYFFRPAWLVPFTLPAWEVASRRYTLSPTRRRVEDRAAGYRAAPRLERVTLPTLPTRVEIGDDVLQADPTRVTLRRGYRLFNRFQWLVRIHITQEGDDVLLSARLLVFPTITLFALPLMALTIVQQPIGLLLGLVAAGIGTGVNLSFAAFSCRQPADHALAWIEGHHREQLGLPADR